MSASPQHRTRYLALLPVFILMVAVVPHHSAAAQPRSNATYLIHFRAETSSAERQAVLESLDVVPLQWLPQANVVAVAPRRSESVFSSTALDATSLYVDYIEPDTTVTGALELNDPAFATPELTYGQRTVQAPQGWEMGTGVTQTIIAIIDSGINPQHPEFSGRTLPGYDFINIDDAPLDDHGHGTHVAGIAAAMFNNGQGAAGICPNCMLLPVKVLNAQNTGTWGTVAAGIYYAVDQGADVINLSLGAAVSSRTLEAAIQYAADHDVVIVAAAGNSGNTAPFYPAALPDVVAVGATNSDDQAWVLSNMGDHIDLTAPGHRIYSTYHLLEFGGYTTMSGTSMAAPFVTGLAGLLSSFKPELTSAEIIELMITTADDRGAPGKDPVYGYGRINVYRAMVAANHGEEPEIDPPQPPPGDPVGADPSVRQTLLLPAIQSH